MSPAAAIGVIATPAGRFGAAFSERGLGRLTFPDEPLDACAAWTERWAPGARPVEDDPRLGELAAQLAAYFRGERVSFSLPLDLRGTAFQLQVWEALQRISYGEVWSYARLAAAVGRPSAMRAVGAANGANPVPIIVPCHRVIGANGSLVGYAGGLALKERLLKLEGALLAE